MFFYLLATCLFLVHLCNAASLGSVNGKVKNDCDSPIYCRGELLKTMQLAELFTDSKSFVDLHQLNDPDVTLSNFNALMQETGNNPNRSQLEVFLNENFSQDSELDVWSPPDWEEEPANLLRIKDPKFRKWALDLNVLWKKLARKIKPEVAEHPNRHSLIYVKNGFVVPGGRFREFYYWDSYWAMTGMLISGMHQTVRGMLENFFSMVETYGFIPNGGRIYYLMRSQPPFLIPMAEKYLEFTQDMEFLRENVATLEREFAYWLREKFVDVEKDGKSYKLARYFVTSEGPRPESYREDYELGQKVGGARLEAFYDDLKAAAESGWDFSGRWFDESDGELGNLSTISTRTIIPVELNAFLQRNARILGEFHLKLNNPLRARYYANIAEDIQDGIDNVLWNEAEQIWLDYDTTKQRSRNRFYPTNLSPLYTNSYNVTRAKELAEGGVFHLKKHGVTEFMGGTPASKDNTGEQWDFPNAWPPLQSMIVLGLRGTGWEPATSLAKTLATRWLRANYIGFSENQEMFEKYDAITPGQRGGGGEYIVQAGFGWTNGVAMEFLDIYSGSITSEDNGFASDGENAER